MLHPLSPFITEYLYLTCFSRKKSILLENWPHPDQKFVNSKIESVFDRIKDIVSLANAARNLAGLKRRWPIKEVIVCGHNLHSLDTEGTYNVLVTQLNAANYRLAEIPTTGSQLEKVASLLGSNMPISVNAVLIRKNIAPRVKADINRVAQSFDAVDKLELVSSLQESGTYLLAYNGKTVEISPSDIEVTYKALEGYTSSERDDLIVFVSTIREKDLTMKGLLRDLARQLQQLRKERRYNPTDTVNAAYIAGLDEEEIESLSTMNDEMAYLVRVKTVQLSKEAITNVSYKVIEIDGREFRISVE
jgi:isoleucyl-tRNA synthetase